MPSLRSLSSRRRTWIAGVTAAGPCNAASSRTPRARSSSCSGHKPSSRRRDSASSTQSARSMWTIVPERRSCEKGQGTLRPWQTTRGGCLGCPCAARQREGWSVCRSNAPTSQGVRNWEADDDPNSPHKGFVDGLSQVGGEDREASVRLHALEQVTELNIGIAIAAVLDLAPLA